MRTVLLGSTLVLAVIGGVMFATGNTLVGAILFAFAIGDLGVAFWVSNQIGRRD